MLAGEMALQTMTRDLILLLADSKRLLGTRYAEWILGAPELETGIACASMAQDEWGHARLFYALLKDFGEDIDRLEHGRAPDEYANMEVLDRAPQSWADFVAMNALVDAALTVQLRSLVHSSYAPLRQRVGKPIDEEHFHAAHGLAWVKRLASGTAESRAQLEAALQKVIPAVLRWFGPESDLSREAVSSGLLAHGPDLCRARWLAAIAPALEAVELTALAQMPPDFSSFDIRTRRTVGSAPDAETIERVRGDRNRAFLMD
jgi:ring-1,2-phenylacetyl-CoA epoxidase subunit PaaC